MKFLYSLVGILIIGSMMAFIHPIHLSITNVDFNEANHALEITHRFFVEDFEQRLEKEYGVELYLGTPSEHPEADQYIQQFLGQNFNIIVNKKEVERIFIGKEIESEAIWVYIEVPKVKKLQQASVKNNILTDTFADQRNFINFKHPNGKKAVILTAQKPQDIVLFNE